MSLVYTLPVEVLAYIFQLAKDDIIVLSHVSFRFRSIAIRSRVLWSSISINSDHSLFQIQSFIERAKGCQLDVFFEEESAVDKINSIIPYASNYRKLVIHATRESASHPLIRCFSNVAMPALQHLSIAVDEIEDYSPLHAFIIGGAPNLSFVRLRGLAFPLFCPPLTHVTTLHLDQTVSLPILYSTFRHILAAPRALINLSVYGDIIAPNPSNDNPWPQLTLPPIHLPYLLSLRICGVDGSIYSGLPLAINAPALHSLVLKDLNERDLDRYWDFSLHTSPFPALQLLTLLDSHISTDVYLHLFHSFPHITSFFAANNTMSLDALLLLLEPSLDTNNIPWPMLHTLTLFTDVSHLEHIFTHLVKRRIQLGHPLKKLRLGMSEPLSSLYCYRRLRTKIDLEAFTSPDPWPTNILDPDDDLFFDSPDDFS